MIGVDTNVLVYAANSDHPAHQHCLLLLRGGSKRPAERLAPETLCLTWSVVYEFLRVVTHPAVLSRPFRTPDAWEFVTRLLAAPHVRVLGPGADHAAAAGPTLAAPGIRGNLVHDAHIVAVLAEHGVRRIYSNDADLRRFPGLAVVDPLA